jgi:hypothetical protein
MIPTYSPWLNPAEMLWRRLRREVTHCELFESIDALLDATRAFFDRRSDIWARPVCNRSVSHMISDNVPSCAVSGTGGASLTREGDLRVSRWSPWDLAELGPLYQLARVQSRLCYCDAPETR